MAVDSAKLRAGPHGQDMTRLPTRGVATVGIRKQEVGKEQYSFYVSILYSPFNFLKPRVLAP